MTGTITESFLIDTAQAGPRHSPYSIHKITTAPLKQDFQRDISVWGMLFKFNSAAGTISPFGFSFTTRGEGKGDGSKAGLFQATHDLNEPVFWLVVLAPPPSSPISLKSTSLKTVSSPLHAVKGSTTYLSSRSFDETSMSTTRSALYFSSNAVFCTQFLFMMGTHVIDIRHSSSTTLISGGSLLGLYIARASLLRRRFSDILRSFPHIPANYMIFETPSLPSPHFYLFPQYLLHFDSIPYVPSELLPCHHT